MYQNTHPTGRLPQEPGHYWAKWLTAAEGTIEGDEITPALRWEIVQVNVNALNWKLLTDEQDMDRLSVFVPGVQQTQRRDFFLWGEFVAPLGEVRLDGEC